MRGLHEPLPGLCRGRRTRLWLGLSGPDGIGADAGPRWPRRSRASAQGLDLLRTLRKRLPGQNPAAQAAAPLARAAIRGGAGAARGARRPRPVALGGDPAGALSPARRARREGFELGRARPRTVPQPAFRRRLDARARHAGARRPHLPAALGGAAETMSASRDVVLGNIRGALGRGGLPAESQAALAERVAAHRRNLIPARAAALDRAARIDLFSAMAEEVQTTVVRVASADAVAGEVARYLAAENLAAELVMAPDPALDGMGWEDRPLLRIRRGRAESSDAVSVTPCLAAVAETGTLMLTSGPDTPTTLNFLPDTHIVVVRADQVVASYEDRWDRVRALRDWPRT